MSLSYPRRDLQTNVVGTFNVLQFVRQRSPEAFIEHSSINKVFGGLEYLRYEETATRYPLTDYPEGLSEAPLLVFSTPFGCSKGA